MKVTTYFLFLILAIQSSSLGASAAELTTKESTALTEAASKIFTAMKEKDWKTVVETTHPGIAKLAGGKEKLAEVTRKAFSTFDSIGLRFEKESLGKPGRLFEIEAGQLCFLPKEAIIVMQGRKVWSQNYLVCIRERPGAKWLFIDGTGVSQQPDRLWQIFPDLPKSAKLPEIKRKILE
ncbi:MAG: hypothetical protein ACPGVU_25230 [Limisphaerales bacterium]